MSYPIYDPSTGRSVYPTEADWKTVPARRATPAPDTTDCEAIMDALFKDRRPEKMKSQTFAYRIYQSIWIREKNKFTIVSGIHQNHSRDVLHFGVRVEVAAGWFQTLHFNGYWLGGFQLTTIEASARNRDGVYEREIIWAAEEVVAAEDKDE